MIKKITFIDKPLFIKIKPICLYENSTFKKYKNPPKIILAEYKYIAFLNVYLILLYPKLTINITKLIIILYKKSINELVFINKKIILTPPMNDPNIIL